jgi:cytochrome c oxidase cbb3-type subunit 3
VRSNATKTKFKQSLNLINIMTEKDHKEQEKKPDVTGHEWDGISEYNVPAPRWWLIVFIICIIWSFGYWIFYPAWPTISGNSKGVFHWSKQSQLTKNEEELNAKKSVYLQKISQMNFAQIQQNPELMEFAINGGRAAFKENCAACHGSGAQGAKGFPNLNDDDWLWGGKIEDIYQTIRFGIRSAHEKTRSNQMPAFGMDKVLKRDEIEATVEYVLSLYGKAEKNLVGEKIFKANCISCHGADGKGMRSMGAPNLTDAIWLYGGKKEDIFFTIYYARNGVMPYWVGRLDDNTIKQLALYVHSLGGGE